MFERRASVASEGSFAQTGLLAACAPLPWGVPGLQRSRLAHWLKPQGTVRAGLYAAFAHAPWLLKQQQAESAALRLPRQRALHALAHASRRRLGEWTEQLKLAYEQHPGGLVLLSQPEQVTQVRRALESSAGMAEGLALIEADEARQLEPGLAAKWPLKGAVKLPSAMVGNGRQLAHLLKGQAQRMQANFRFDCEVQALRPGQPASLVTADGQTHQFDAIVVCAGIGSRRLLASAGVKLPLLVTRFHAITAPLAQTDADAAPSLRAAVVDGSSGIVIARLGQRIRVSGITRLSTRLGASSTANDGPMPKAVQAQLYAALEAAFPGSAVAREASHWHGPRVRVPDGAPVIGPSKAPGVWLNLGHGASGWALAFGAAQMLARQLSDQPLPFDGSAFAASRLG